MGKKGNGEGSIRKRTDGRYEARISELDPKSGRTKRISIYGSTRREVATEMARRIANPEKYQRPELADDAVGPFLDRWLASKHNIRPNTRAWYRRTIDNYIKPEIGAIPLERLTPSYVEGLVSSWAAKGKMKTADGIHQILTTAFKWAVKLELLNRNPVAAVDSVGYKPKERKTLSVEQVHEMAGRLYDHRWFALFYTAISLGANRAELLGLRWQDVNLQTGTVKIHQVLTRVDGQFILGEPKTENRKAIVTLPPVAVEALKRHKRRQAAERLQAGDAWQDNDLVFCRPDGSMTYPDSVTQWWYKQIRRTSLPRISFHDLRHTHATILLENGESLSAISKRLRHGDIYITGKIYAHVTKRMEEETVSRLEGILNPSQPLQSTKSK